MAYFLQEGNITTVDAQAIIQRFGSTETPGTTPMLLLPGFEAYLLSKYNQIFNLTLSGVHQVFILTSPIN